MNTLIVTFYAYKGGTGRTLALSNVARFLADELGYRVGIIDLDLESPGLAHEHLCEIFDSNSEEQDALLKRIDAKSGFIECYLDRKTNPNSSADSIHNYVVALTSGRSGSIILMPAAQHSATKDAAYADNVSNFLTAISPSGQASGGRDAVEAETVNLASETTWTILRDFAEQYQLDFLFIDGRTGTGPFFSPVYMYSVPHLLVLFSGLNDQNILGSLATLQITDAAANDEIPVSLVVSPVPTVGPAAFEQRLNFIGARLGRARKERAADPSNKYRYKLPTTADHFLPYSDAASFGEAYFPGSYPNSSLAQAYRKLAHSIAELVIRKPEDNQALVKPTAGSRGEPIRVALENVHQDILKFDGLELKLEPFNCEDENSPWERLLSCDGSKAGIADLLSKLPDVVIIPQTHLQRLAPALARELLHDLNSLRLVAGERRYVSLDFEFLDAYYLNWRHWCSAPGGLSGLPFSVNAMLLCGNADKLRPICDAYWKKQRQGLREPFFLPSSWDSTIALIRAGIGAGDNANRIFRIVEGDRGLYYDWLNFISSMGGFDFIQSEGRVTQDLALVRHETIEATRRFVELARLCGRSDQIYDQTIAFSRGELAMYIGWTDIFRFSRDQDDLFTGISTCTPVTKWLVTAKREKQDIRLGHSPRDMRFPRNMLVDGWVMVFPKKSQEHLHRALRFADRFLEPSEQRRLLRDGFPSPSAWAIDQELAHLRAQRTSVSEPSISDKRKHTHDRTARSFETFLETMRLAIESGKWISSPRTTLKIEVEVAHVLRLLIDGKADLVSSIQGLAAKIKKNMATPDSEISVTD